MNDVISGEVVTSADMELCSDVDALDQMDAEAREVAVTGILQQSRDWLVRAQTATDPARAVSEFKAYIATVAETSKQLKLSKEIQQDAIVMVRRAERSLGMAVRSGQSEGTVETNSDASSRAAIERDLKLGRSTKSSGEFVDRKTRVLDVMTPTERSGGKSSDYSVFKMVDNVADSEFEDAIDQALAEGNVSRANVTRKIKAGKGAYESKAEPAKGNRRRADKQLSVLRNITRTLGTLEMAVNELITAGFDTAMTQEETAEIIDGLNQFACTTKRIKKHLTN